MRACICHLKVASDGVVFWIIMLRTNWLQVTHLYFLSKQHTFFMANLNNTEIQIIQFLTTSQTSTENPYYQIINKPVIWYAFTFVLRVITES